MAPAGGGSTRDYDDADYDDDADDDYALPGAPWLGHYFQTLYDKRQAQTCDADNVGTTTAAMRIISATLTARTLHMYKNTKRREWRSLPTALPLPIPCTEAKMASLNITY